MKRQRKAMIFQRPSDKATTKTYCSVNAAVKALLRKPRTERWEVWDDCGEHLQAWINGDGHVYRTIRSNGFRVIA
jgi:hypothetical protein